MLMKFYGELSKSDRPYEKGAPGPHPYKATDFPLMNRMPR